MLASRNVRLAAKRFVQISSRNIVKSITTLTTRKALNIRNYSWPTTCSVRFLSGSSDETKEDNSDKSATTEEISSVKEDKELLNNFYTGLAKLSGNDALIESGRTAEFDKLVSSLLRENLYPIMLAPAVLNPLLSKYGFDLKEFGLGAKDYAYPTINTLLATLIDAVHNPDKYSKETISTKSSELKAHVGDQEWKNIEKLLEDKDYEGSLVRRVPESYVKQVNLFYLNTRIVGEYPAVIKEEEDNKEEDNKDTGTNDKGDNSDDDSFDEVDMYSHNKFGIPKRKLSKAEDLRRYRKGSVVATVRCSFFVHQPMKNAPTSTLLVETWSFEGCISGQTPLEWIVTDVQGPKMASFFQHFWYHMLGIAGKFTLFSLGDRN